MPATGRGELLKNSIASQIALQGSRIMVCNNSIVRERQLAVRREMDRRQISLKCVSADSGIPYPTVVSYFPGEKNKVPHTMPVSALFALCRALPLDLLSMLLPDDVAILRVSEGADHDELAALCLDYAMTHTAARHPESEAGVDIGPNENRNLSEKVTRLGAQKGG
jgi:hypothetical protein